MSKCIRRWLKAGDEVPNSKPTRYLSSAGYVTLQWKLQPGIFVRVYEHRLVAGLPSSDLDVHHINGVKTDNRPENLQVLSRSSHAELAVGFDVDAAASAYLSGASFNDISRSVGIDATSVLRTLKRRGLKPRPRLEDRTHCKNGHEFSPSNTSVIRLHGRTRGRRCLTCSRVASRAYLARKAAAL